MKLWEKGIKTNADIHEFTIGEDRQIDIFLAKWDVIGSMAHARMLMETNLIDKKEWEKIHQGLKHILTLINQEGFNIPEEFEDIHSYVEYQLTQDIGDTGKKLHTGRSRNDQVLLDIKLFFREHIHNLVQESRRFFDQLIDFSDAHKEVIIPGYTHFQAAMPSSVGLWAGGYAESLVEDIMFFKGVFDIINHNPLGSGAGFGSSFPLNRERTTRLLSFQNLSYNSVNAQLGRGKAEKLMAFAIANLAATFSKWAMDICMYLSQNFHFFTLKKEFTTGSSIMPQKKNPDVFELIRARCNNLQAIPNSIQMVTTNLPSGYHRDFQILKEIIIPASNEILTCIKISQLAIQGLEVNPDIMTDKRYQYIYSVERINEWVVKGMTFRDAYIKVAGEIETGTFVPLKKLNHSHEGSIGNLCTDEIISKMDSVLQSFSFNQIEQSIKNLLELK